MEKLPEKVFCLLCNRKTNHGIIAHHSEEERHPDELNYQEDFYISVCLGCDEVNFTRIYHDQTMVRFNPYEQEYENFEDIHVYPPEPISNVEVEEIFNPHKGKKFNNLPEVIKTLYKEVVKAYNSNLFLLSAIGMRMIIEGIVKDLEIKDGFIIDDETGVKKVNGEGKEVRSSKLVGQINGMIEKGVIVQNQSRILHQIRSLGNQTAHELKKPSGRTISTGIEIIESILEMIYELDTFNILKK